MPEAAAEGSRLVPYLPRLGVEWATSYPQRRFLVLDGSLVFIDVSGFTALSERLAGRGRIGAEELTATIDHAFSAMLSFAYGLGGSLLKFGGDALLLMFTDAGHEAGACQAALGMRAALRDIGSLQTTVGRIGLRMSVGVHSGEIHLFRVGRSHRELLLTGPAATAVVQMESEAGAGEILISPTTAAAIPPALRGPARGAGFLLRGRAGPPGGGPVRPTIPDGDLLDSTPLGLREHLLAGADDGEHRQATVAFVKVSGTDDVLSGAGARKLASVLDSLIADVQDAADAEGVTFLGTDVDVDGAKLILVGGAPVARHDDAGRVLRAARRIVARRRALAVRVGVHRGHVFAGVLGPEYRRTYTVMGDTVNLAARLMAHARPGHVLATAVALDRAATRFHVDAIEPLRVKGKTAPVVAFDVGDTRGARQSVPRLAGSFVGRRVEVETLLAAMDRARMGRGTVVQIVGDTGMGKSRLVQELRDRAGDVSFLTAACEPSGTSIPYRPIRALLQGWLGVGDDDPGSVWPLFRDRVAAAAPDLAPWLPLFSGVFGTKVPDSPATAPLSGRYRKERLEQVAGDLLGRLLSGPTILAFEDVHWIDAASADLLTHIAARIEDRPWLLCVTRRDADTAFLGAEVAAGLTVTLEPLGPGDATALVHAGAEDTPLRPHDVAELVRRSGGHPLFLEELLRAAVASGGAGGLPSTIEEIVAAQIDALAPAPKRLLRHAAVLGQSFHRTTLTTLTGQDFAEADDAWHALHLFLVEDGGRFRFRHVLVQTVAYECLPYRRRRELHALAGLELERAARHPESLAEDLSLHFLEGEQYEKAWRYATLGAERARAAWANSTAGDLFERALRAARHLPELDAADVAAAYEALGEARDRAGQYDRAAVAFQRARRLCADDPIGQVSLHLRHAWLHERQGTYSGAVRWIRRADRLLGEIASADATRLRAQLTLCYASVRQGQGRSRDAVVACREAIEAALAAADRHALARTYAMLDWAYVEQGRFDLAVNSVEALAIFEDLGDLEGQVLVANNLGGFAYYQGRWDEAVALYERSKAAAARCGDAVRAAFGTSNIGEILCDQGRLDESEAHQREALRVWRAAGYRRGIALASMHLGRVAARAGRPEEAGIWLSAAHDGFHRLEAHGEELEVQVRRAEAHVLRGDGDAAYACATDALLADHRRGGGEVRQPGLRRLRGYALAQLGRIEDAADEMLASLHGARAIAAEYEVALSVAALRWLAAAGGPHVDPDAVAEADAVLARLGVRSIPDVPVPTPTG